ncbi:MAG: DUF4924 family protein [Brumimicrobium sp.]|nr:DUF4924 family protein [Brumimicrobium sp.]MCO5268816.1 DUF4924 family protein [Brumimicrobium sp.]
MLIAQERFESNIAEYIIYMYQIEDLMRAYTFDLDQITENIIQPQVKEDEDIQPIISWYEEIIEEMNSRGLQKKGHLYRVGEVMTELIYLHKMLMEVAQDEQYIHLLSHAEENVKAFRDKSDLKDNHLVEICFQALYLKLLLKLKGSEIGKETEKALDTMREVLAYLSNAYHMMKSGDMSMFEPKKED